MDQLLEARTDAERAFLTVLLGRHPDIDVWFHTHPDGRPWLIASLDFSEDKHIHDTLRLDFDGRQIFGGWSPAFLNWDDGVPATDAGIDTRPPDGIALADRSPEELAEAAAEWFERHRRTWAGSERAHRWRRLPQRRPVQE